MRRAGARLSALSDRTESSDRQEIAPDQQIGASSDRKSRSTFSELALALSLRNENEGVPTRNQLLDTVGAIMIACGNTEAQVRERLDLRRRALTDSAGEAVKGPSGEKAHALMQSLLIA
jgi:hypothetical protein